MNHNENMIIDDELSYTEDRVMSSREFCETINQLLEQAEYQKVIELCNEAIEGGGYTDILPFIDYSMGHAFFGLNQRETACEIYFESIQKYSYIDPTANKNIMDYFTSEANFPSQNLLKWIILNLKFGAEDLSYVKVLLSSALYQMGKTEIAIEVLKEVLEVHPGCIPLLHQLAGMYYSTRSWINMAMVYLGLGNWYKEMVKMENICSEEQQKSIIDQCLYYYSNALVFIPNNMDLLIGLIQIHRMTEKYKEAFGYIGMALKVDDKDYRIYYEGFLTYEEIGDNHTAKEMIRICLMLNITFVKGFNAFGNILRKEKMYECAIDVFETALMREPENLHVLNNYATCLLEMGNKSKAKEIYLQAYHLDNNLFEANCNLATIYRKEYDFDKAIEHILKAKDIESRNPQVYNILTSIYIASDLHDVAVSSCLKSLEYDPNNSITLLQLARCYKTTSKYKEAIDICLNLLKNNPKCAEAFVLYIESIISTNFWIGLDENKTNINNMAQFHKHSNMKNSLISPFIADFLISDFSNKVWIHEVNCNKEITNAKYIYDEFPNYESENSKRGISKKKMKIGYIIDDVLEEYTANLMCQLLSNHNSNQNEIFIIIFNSEKCNKDAFDWENYLKNSALKKFTKFFVDLTEQDNPRVKAEFLFKCQFDFLIYLEHLTNLNKNYINSQIYQTFAIHPATVQIILPSDSLPRSPQIFDYLITDEFTIEEKYREVYKEKLIIFNDISRFCFNPYLNLDMSLNESFNIPDPFVELRKNNFKILANFSPNYKIDREIFVCWCRILKTFTESYLVLRFMNQDQVENMKYFAQMEGVQQDRIIFATFQNNNDKYETAAYVKHVDLYLDIQTVNADFEIFFCLFSDIPVVTIRNEDFPITSSISTSILHKLDEKHICFNYDDYKNKAVDLLLTEHPADNKNSVKKSRKKSPKIQNQQNNNLPVGNNEIDFMNYLPFVDFVKNIEKAVKQIKKNYAEENKDDVRV